MTWPEASVFLGPDLVGLGRSHEAVRVARVPDQHEAPGILARRLIPGWPTDSGVPWLRCLDFTYPFPVCTGPMKRS